MISKSLEGKGDDVIKYWYLLGTRYSKENGKDKWVQKPKGSARFPSLGSSLPERECMEKGKERNLSTRLSFEDRCMYDFSNGWSLRPLFYCLE